jgi:amino acid transporter
MVNIAGGIILALLFIVVIGVAMAIVFAGVGEGVGLIGTVIGGIVQFSREMGEEWPRWTLRRRLIIATSACSLVAVTGWTFVRESEHRKDDFPYFIFVLIVLLYGSAFGREAWKKHRRSRSGAQSSLPASTK